jgi:hypothetical protein
MSKVKWESWLGGNWNAAANWSYGAAPTASDDAVFDLPGNYTAYITSPPVTSSLTFNAPGATLDQTGGSLAVGGSVNIYNGVVSLNDANNTIANSVSLYGGVLEVGSGTALGASSILAYGGEFLGTSTETIANTRTR